MSGIGTPGQQMSSALKERLRRSGRTYRTPSRSSPVHVVNNTPLQGATNPSPSNRGSNLTGNDKHLAYSDSGSPTCTPVSSRKQLSPDCRKLTLDSDIDSAKSCQMMLLMEAESIEKSPERTSTSQATGAKSICSAKASCAKDAERSKRLRTEQRIESRTNPCSADVSTLVHRDKDSTSDPLPCGSNQMDICTPPTGKSIKQQCTALRQRVASKEEILRKLHMVKLYREKNDLTTLCNLTNKWREVAQQAIQDIHDLAPEPKPTLTELVDYLQIDHDFIGYDAEQETFR